MDRRENEQLLKAIRQARAAGEAAALAMVVRIRGSAYRREGTRMFVRQDGSYECALSGGCLEPTVTEAAERVIATGEPVVVTYDLANDSVWGLGIGCSGAVDIRIERLEDDAITRRMARHPRTRGTGRARDAAVRGGGTADRPRQRRGCRWTERRGYPAGGVASRNGATVRAVSALRPGMTSALRRYSSR